MPLQADLFDAAAKAHARNIFLDIEDEEMQLGVIRELTMDLIRAWLDKLPERHQKIALAIIVDEKLGEW